MKIGGILPHHAVFHNNHLYVTNCANSEVVVYNDKWTPVRTFGNGILKHPIGITIIKPTTYGNSFSVVVTDIHLHTLNFFDENGKLLRQCGLYTGSLFVPLSVIENRGLLYVVDGIGNRIGLRIRVINAYDGTYIRSFSGNDDVKISIPSCIAIYDDKIYVPSKGNDCVQVFNLDGLFVCRFGDCCGDSIIIPTPFFTYLVSTSPPVSSASACFVRIVVADGHNDRIQIFDGNGILVRSFPLDSLHHRLDTCGIEQIHGVTYCDGVLAVTCADGIELYR